MSTKLHHGYRLAAGTDPFRFIAIARPSLDAARDRADASLLAERAVDIIDGRAASLSGVDRAENGLKAALEAPLIKALLDLEDEQSKLREYDRGKDPNRLEVAIGVDPQTGRLGALLFAENPGLIDAFEALHEVEKYPYWNGSDRPDELTEDQWNERREFWDRVLPGYTPPAEAMFTWCLRGTYHPGTMSLAGDRSPLILEQVPSPESRARRLAQQVVTRAACTGVTGPREVMRVVFDATKWREYPEVVDAAAALIVDVDFDLLLGVRESEVDDVEMKRSRLLELATTAGERFRTAKEG